MDRIKSESIGGICPAFTDELVWRQSLERLQSPCVVICVYEVVKVLRELFMIVVVIALDRCFFDRAGHSPIPPLIFNEVVDCITVVGLVAEKNGILLHDL